MSFLSYLPTSSGTVSLYFVFVVCANLMVQVESKSFFGIGKRISGDQMLLKDVLHTPPISLTEEPVIKFQYAIVEPISYLEIESNKGVHANVNFNYELNLVEGTISSLNNQHTRTVKPEPFAVLIRIYGFNDTMLNINPSYILNKDQEFNGVLKPIYQQNKNQSLSLMEEDSKALEDYDLYYDNEDAIDDDEDTEDEKDIDYEEEDFNKDHDKIIEQGQRQEGDFLVYECEQTSGSTTELPTNHSVIFYYVDVFYITYVKFTIYEHYLYHPSNNYDNTYVVEYAHISPTTLKAIVTDHRTTSLFVQMQMYGFHPSTLPVDYKPFLSNSQTSATTRPISSLTQLKMLMNAQQSTTKQQQENTTNGSLLQQQPKELGHQISPDNNVNCMQQVLSTPPNAGNDSQSIFAYWSNFNLMVIILVAMMTMLFSQ